MAFLWVRPKQVRDEEIRVFYIVAGQASEDEDEDADDEEYASDDAEDDTGAVLGERFELLEAIAWGGTAAVYRARDHVTKAEVAVKVLCSGVRAQLGRYFGQEGRLAAQLCNPHLVRAHHFGVDEGRPFIVFDLVPGRSLPALYFKQPMPWRELCEAVLGLLDALGTMHQQGIVHRDVKPENIMVGGDGRARTAGFQIASSSRGKRAHSAGAGGTTTIGARASARPTTVATTTATATTPSPAATNGQRRRRARVSAASMASIVGQRRAGSAASPRATTAATRAGTIRPGTGAVSRPAVIAAARSSSPAGNGATPASASYSAAAKLN